MAQSSKKPRRSVLIISRILATLVCYASAESALWFFGYPSWWAMDPNARPAAEYQCDSDLGWSARPGVYDLMRTDTSGATVVFRYSNVDQGRRATSERKSTLSPQGKLLFFGDSFIQGYGLTDTDTLPWIVQKRHPELEVANYGAGLYGTYQSYLAMNRWVKSPASVYYMFNSFHEGRNVAAPDFLRILKAPPEGCFFPYAKLSGDQVDPGRSRGEVMWFLSRHSRTIAMAQEYKQIFESYWRIRSKRRTTELLLVQMNQLVRSRGGNLTVILFDLDPRERQHYREFLGGEKIETVDSDHPEMNDKSLRLSDGHPTGKLNALLADWIEPLHGRAPAAMSARAGLP